MKIKTILNLAALSLGLTSAASAITFNFSGGAGEGSGTNTLSFTSGITVQVTGHTYYNNAVVQKSVGQYSGGLGVNSNSGPSDTGSPQHAVDNQNGVNMLLFAFSTQVNVSQLSIGWVSGDSDFRYWLGGAGSTAASLFGNGTGGTAVNGGTGGNGADYNISGTGSYLLVAADPAGYAAATNSYWSWSTWSWVQGTPENPYDYFKLDGLTVSTPPSVPDAGSSVALLGLALLGLVACKRRFTA